MFFDFVKEQMARIYSGIRNLISNRKRLPKEDNQLVNSSDDSKSASVDATVVTTMTTTTTKTTTKTTTFSSQRDLRSKHGR